MDFELGLLIGGILGVLAGWALALTTDWVRERIEERMPVDTDDRLDRIRRLR